MHNSNESTQQTLGTINLQAYSEYNQKEVTGQQVIDTVEKYPQLGIYVGNLMSDGSYSFKYYNKPTSIKEDELDLLRLTSYDDDDLEILFGVQSEYTVDVKGHLQDGTEGTSVIELQDYYASSKNIKKGAKPQLTVKSDVESYVPQYSNYYARLITDGKGVQGIAFKEVP